MFYHNPTHHSPTHRLPPVGVPKNRPCSSPRACAVGWAHRSCSQGSKTPVPGRASPAPSHGRPGRPGEGKGPEREGLVRSSEGPGPDVSRAVPNGYVDESEVWWS